PRAHRHHRGPGRVPAQPQEVHRQPARAPRRHPQLLERPALGPPPGPRRGADRRDARLRDRRGGAAHRRDRPPDLRHPAHQLCGADHQPHRRHLPRPPAGADPGPALLRPRGHHLPIAPPPRHRQGAGALHGDPGPQLGDPQPHPRGQGAPDLRHDADRPVQARHADLQPAAGGALLQAHDHSPDGARTLVLPGRAPGDHRPRSGLDEPRHASPGRRGKELSHAQFRVEGPRARRTGAGGSAPGRLARRRRRRPAPAADPGHQHPREGARDQAHAPPAAAGGRQADRHLHPSVLGHAGRRTSPRAVPGDLRRPGGEPRLPDDHPTGEERRRVGRLARRLDEKAPQGLRRALRQHGGRRRSGGYPRRHPAAPLDLHREGRQAEEPGQVGAHLPRHHHRDRRLRRLHPHPRRRRRLAVPQDLPRQADPRRRAPEDPGHRHAAAEDRRLPLLPHAGHPHLFGRADPGRPGDHRQDRRQCHHRGRRHGGPQERRGRQDDLRAAGRHQGVPADGRADDQRRRADRRLGSDAVEDRRLLRGGGRHRGRRPHETARAGDDHHPGRRHRHHRGGDVPAALLGAVEDRAKQRPSGRIGPMPGLRRAEAVPTPALARQLRWYIALRVVAIGSVLLPSFLLQLIWGPPQPPEIGPTAFSSPPAQILTQPLPLPRPEALQPGFLYTLAAATFVATLFYIALLRLLKGHYPLQAYIQFGGDLLLITAMVQHVGGIASPFSMLYLIVIAVDSTLLRRRAGVIVASAAYLLYASLLLGLYFGWLPQPNVPGAETVSIWRLNYNLAVHFFGFYGVAFLTSFLAHNVTRAERALEEKSEDLADLRVVHRDVIESISSGLITADL